MKTFVYVIFSIAALVIAFFSLNAYIYREKQGESSVAQSHRDATYVIEGSVVTLKDGLSEVTIPGAPKVVTRYFGNEIIWDFDSDGRDDVAFILTQDKGGGEIYYYVVAALNKPNGYVGSQALFLGDRIAPQTTEKGEGKIIIVNYADRKLGEGFEVMPSVGKSIRLILDPQNMQFGEVAANFEGEANPDMMSLGMKSWTWINAKVAGSTITPKNSGAFTLSFGADGGFSATTDCNSMGGKYVVTGTVLSLSDIFSTKKYCEGSQEMEFSKILGSIRSFSFTSKGELVFALTEGGTATFR